MTTPTNATGSGAELPALRMNAYYFGFSPTGVREIDVILSAVASAGKAYHHTESWTDECDANSNVHRGSSCAEWIQRAAEDAAKAFRAAQPAPPAFREVTLEDVATMIRFYQDEDIAEGDARFLAALQSIGAVVRLPVKGEK